MLGRLVGAGSKVPPESEDLQKLLTTPLETLALKVLKLENFPPLMATLRYVPRKRVAMQLLRSVVDVSGSQVDSVKMCEQLLTFISPLIQDEDDTPQNTSNGGGNNNNTMDEFTMEQRLVSRLIALIEHPDTDVVFNIANLARKAFRKGGFKTNSLYLKHYRLDIFV